MGIPIGKLSLYCAAGGIAPHRVLPVVLDVGTDNEEILNDKYYLGMKKKRLKGPRYFELVDEFMNAVRHRWPNVLVQFEDFNSSVAQKLLDTYRDTHLCFNDVSINSSQLETQNSILPSSFSLVCNGYRISKEPVQQHWLES